MDNSADIQPRRRSIRRKLSAIVFVSVGVAVTLITVVSAVRHSQREAALQTERLTATATVIGSLSGEAADRGDGAAAYRAIRAIGAMPDILYARVEGANGYTRSRVRNETSAGRRPRRAGAQRSMFDRFIDRPGCGLLPPTVEAGAVPLGSDQMIGRPSLRAWRQSLKKPRPRKKSTKATMMGQMST